MTSKRTVNFTYTKTSEILIDYLYLIKKVNLNKNRHDTFHMILVTGNMTFT